VLSYCINSAIIIGIYFLADQDHHVKNAIILGVALAWAFSHNGMFGIGILSPFKVVNEKLEQ
jgi:hypothetical protein